VLHQVRNENTPRAAGPYSPGIRCGQLLFVSGQGPFEPKSGQIPGDSIEAQTRQTLENVRAILAAGGTDLAHVVKATVILTDMSLFGRMNEVYKQYFTEPYPARVTFGAALANPKMLVEIDAVAYLGD